MFGSTIIKTIFWDPFPGLLKVFIAYLLLFLVISLFWKLILMLRYRARGPNASNNNSKTNSKKSSSSDGGNGERGGGGGVDVILKQANDHYKLALAYAEQKDFKQAITNATKTIAFLQSSLEIASSDAIAKQLNNIPPQDFINLIQYWIDNDLSSGAAAASGSNTNFSSDSSLSPQQRQEALKNSALTFAQLRAKGPFPSRRL